MRPFWALAATLTLATNPARARPDEPPRLGLDSYAARCLGILQQETTELRRRAAIAHRDRKEVLQAAINIRRLAGGLLEAGDRAEENGSVAVLSGYRLFRGRQMLDETLYALLPNGAEGAESAKIQTAREALHQFNSKTSTLMDGTWPPPEVSADSIDATLAFCLQPLAVTIGLLEGAPVAIHWIPHGLRSSLELAVLKQRLPEAPIGSDTRAELGAIAEFLYRGEAFAELRPRVETYARLLIELLDLADAIAEAEWLDEALRAALQTRMHTAVLLFRDQATRQPGRQALRELAALGPLIRRITTLSVEDEIDLKQLRAALGALVAAGDTAENKGRISQASAQRLGVILQRMVAFRELGDPSRPGELHVVRRKLHEAYRSSERALVARLQELASQPGSLSDPALGSLVADHKQHLENLKWIDMLGPWVAQIRLIQPSAATRFAGRIRTYIQWLGEPSRRPAAILAMDRFQRQLALFHPLPHEDQLREGGAIVATGGLSRELTETIDQVRKRWAQAWAAGDTASQAAARMHLLYRLTKAIAQTQEMIALGDAAGTLDRWAAWELNPSTLAGVTTDLPNRLKLATAAAVDGDDRGLEHQLDSIERDVGLAKLIGRLGTSLSGPLGKLPTGAVSIIGQSVGAPTAQAWLFDDRRRLADLCRYAMELQYAQVTGRRELADGIHRFVNELAEDLVETVHEHHRRWAPP